MNRSRGTGMENVGSGHTQARGLRVKTLVVKEFGANFIWFLDLRSFLNPVSTTSLFGKGA